MKHNFGKHIIKLLKNHECVVLPMFGAFILKDKPAKISENQIFVSSKKILFNTNITSSDNLLQSELMTHSKATFLDSKFEINQFVNNIKFSLQQKGFYDIEDLGRFSMQNNSIVFTEKPQLGSISKSHFGLESLSLQPVLREIVREEKIQRTIPVSQKVVLNKVESNVRIEEQNEVLAPKKIKLIPLIGLAASLILIFTISSLMFTQTSLSGLQIQNANVLNFLVPSKTEVKSTEKVLNRISQEKKRKKASKSNARLSVSEEKPKESEEILASEIEKPKEQVKESKAEDLIYSNILQVESENPFGYYVVIGAFSSLENANKAKYECSLNNTCSVFKTDNGMYRVGIFTSTDKAKAVEIVNEYKAANSSYWLMENK
ncbi:MAG: SPOR domain-containing protein [Chitinophagales bacterium]